jgi:hypothetical protein
MNFETLKNPNDLKLEGIKVTTEKLDDTIKSITLTDSKGNVARFIATSDYSRTIGVVVPAKPKKKTVYVLAGTVSELNLPYERTFLDNGAALAMKASIEDSSTIGHASLKIEPREVDEDFQIPGDANEISF